MLIATATQMKNSFGKYLDQALKNGEVYIERHGIIIAKLIAIERSPSYISDELKGYHRDESIVCQYRA
ncbi:MAG: type II toxin-antitoxin system Phd/YefM family antitoxin [Erysipelotrichaceae bacterium]|nr:type II toxin-antitoxin system Phd/YefM family antitoxin [Erysipelotrichaceae bacterium]MBQ6215940.1 type II toxin-antitoxin system Phd/YefM family antitoxin [Erysipelotrichaceae bacterium]MBR3005083.1 type II toxin-antitoxin system Phd/YefM family antitoxin [Erysipelotrichaceae bacterium]MBR6232800.1 type II toxin-antitoxin system Phd/YefM family antitoxin [Erysipelotrichaceae bacterium]